MKELAGAAHLVLLACGALALSCARRDTRGSGSPDDAAGPEAARVSPWPAFQKGGNLQGEGDALPLERMSLRWEYKIGGGAKSSPAILGGVVYIGGGDGAIHAIDLAQGSLRWKHIPSGEGVESEFFAAPLVFEGRLFIGDGNGTLHAVSIADGGPLWTFKTEGEIKSSVNRVGKSILFGSYDGNLYCVDAETGKEIWKFETAAPVHATPGVVDGTTFCGGCDAVLRAIHVEGREAGQEKWNFEFGDRIAAAPVGFDGKVAAAGLGGLLACFNVADGKQLWQRKIKGEGFFGSPAFSGGLLFLPGSRKAAYCVDTETGEIRWTFENLSGFDGSAAVAGEGVYFPGKDGKLHVLDIKTGEEVWHFSAGGSIEGALAIGEGALVFCDTAGTLYCLCPAEGVRRR